MSSDSPNFTMGIEEYLRPVDFSSSGDEALNLMNIDVPSSSGDEALNLMNIDVPSSSGDEALKLMNIDVPSSSGEEALNLINIDVPVTSSETTEPGPGPQVVTDEPARYEGGRFQALTDDQRNDILEGADSRSTKRQTKSHIKVFKGEIIYTLILSVH